MAHPHRTQEPSLLEEAVTVLFCLIDDAYGRLNPKGRRYAPLKRLSDSEVLALALFFQRLRGVESERSFLRDASRFFSHLFPGVVGLAPSSFHRRVRKLRRFLEPLRREVVAELVGEPETLIADSTLLPVLHPRQGSGSRPASRAPLGRAGAPSASTGSSCTSSAPPTACPSPTSSPPSERRRGLPGRGVAGRGEARGWGRPEAPGGPRLPQRAVEGAVGRVGHPPGDRARGAAARRAAAGGGSLRESEAGLFGLGETLATTLVGLAVRIAAKICAYTYAFLLVNRTLGRPQSKIKELWA